MPDKDRDRKKQNEKIISRTVNYHSKSPNKLLEELQDKNRRSNYRYNKNKKRAFIFSALGGIFVALVAIIWIVFGGGGTDVISSDYIKKIDPFVFKIIAVDEIEYGDENIIKVKVSNITSRESEFLFKNFRFSIISDNGQEVFAFSYPGNLTVKMGGYDSRDVYDFNRENPVFDIRPGTYTIHSDFYKDEDRVELKKQLIIKENVDMSIRLYNDFALPGQQLPVYLSIVNHSPDMKDFNLGTYRVSLKDDAMIETEIYKNSEVIRDITLKPGEKLDVILGDLNFPAESDVYTLDTTYFLNDTLKESEYDFAVHEISSKPRSNNMRILPYTLKKVGIGQQYTAEIQIANDDGKDLYESIKGFIFEIERNGTVLYRYTEYQEGSINIFIPAFSKRKVFDSTEWKEIIFQVSGTYRVKIRVVLENEILEYSEDLLVE
jgi:hypothetical protein